MGVSSVRLLWRDVASRPLVLPAFGLVAGTWLGTQTDAPSGLFLACSGTLAIASIAFSRRSGSHLAVCAALFFAGATLSTLEARTAVPSTVGGATLVEGEVESVDRRRVVVRVARVDGERARFRASLYAHGPTAQVLPGQRIAVRARLRPDEPAANFGQFDNSPYRRRRAIALFGSYDADAVVVASEPPAWRRWLHRAHEALAARVHALAPSPEASALYLTLAAGRRAELSEAAEEDFARSGLAHVLSVSGLHVAALALLTLRLLRWAAVRLWPRARTVDARRLAAPLSIPLVWAYVVYTGSQAPAVRSAVMATAFLTGHGLWRRSDALNSLALAAISLVIMDPAAVADLSTQLSFVAVASLLVLAPAVREALPIPRPDPSRRFYRLQKLAESALSTLCASVAVTLASAPLLAEHFHRISLAGLVSNVVCLPLSALLTVLAATGAAAFSLSPALATPLLYGGAWASELLARAAGAFAALPLSSVDLPSFGSPAAVGFWLGLAAFALARGRWRALAVAAPLSVAFAFGLPRVLPTAGLEVTFLAVGHGDAVVLSSRGEHALVDAGGVPDGLDTGRRYVLPYLREKGISHLKLAVLSHPHPDHGLGLVSTLQQVPTERLWLAAGTDEGPLTADVVRASGGARVEAVEHGHAMRLGDAYLEVLGPPVDRAALYSVNDHSVVLRVRHGEVTFLLTGDIEEAAEEALDVGPVTVVKAPHHGSRTSSTPRFVERTRPRYVVFCVGRRNRFGFPHPEVVERYEAVGAECFRTDLDGAVRFLSDGRDVRVETFLAREAVPTARRLPPPRPLTTLSRDDPREPRPAAAGGRAQVEARPR